LEQIAFGQLRMNVDDFYDMLPREFWNKVAGFHDLENMRQRSDWERTRWSTCLLLKKLKTELNYSKQNIIN
jgi:hypothetical protein